MLIDFLLQEIGLVLAYSSIAIFIFAIAFVVSKSLKKLWPYKAAIGFCLLVYGMLLVGYMHNNGTL